MLPRKCTYQVESWLNPFSEVTCQDGPFAEFVIVISTDFKCCPVMKIKYVKSVFFRLSNAFKMSDTISL